MCKEQAKIQLPWGGQILNYCPTHANQLVILNNAMGGIMKPQLMPTGSNLQCESKEECTEEDIIQNALFPIG